jgi:hypothetical protein
MMPSISFLSLFSLGRTYTSILRVSITPRAYFKASRSAHSFNESSPKKSEAVRKIEMTQAFEYENSCHNDYELKLP